MADLPASPPVLGPALGVADYISAAERENTLRSYESAVRHFEEDWHGLLPATSDQVARYLADYASTLSVNTLRVRLAALSRWHSDQGFVDPTKAPLVRQVLKGIRAMHPLTEKRAKSLGIEVLEEVDQWLSMRIAEAQRADNAAALAQHTRDRSLLLLGFWRGFRSDELVNLSAENVKLAPGEGMVVRVFRSKTDRANLGREHPCPALTRLCPVAAYQAWVELAGIKDGAVYRKVDRWGHVGEEGLHVNSVIGLLRRLFSDAGVSHPEAYSSHSLRRGFAGWARDSGWDLRDLMAYVGWRDVKSAMRYLDASTTALQQRFESGLAQTSSPLLTPVPAPALQRPAGPVNSTR